MPGSVCGCPDGGDSDCSDDSGDSGDDSDGGDSDTIAHTLLFTTKSSRASSSFLALLFG